jgi:putative DNA primase/helicase
VTVLSGDTSQQKIFLLVGPKRSGKGTIGRILTGLLGAENVAAPTTAGLASNFGLSPLIGKPVAIISDARLGGGHAAVIERLLSISGEDFITVDRKHRDPWTGQLPTRFFMISNELPRLTDSSGALASRFLTLVTRRSFYGNENPSLTPTLLAELPGILNWALDGLDELRERGRLIEPGSSREITRELEDLTSPVGAFVRDRCLVAAEQTVSRRELYRAWCTWADEHGHADGRAGRRVGVARRR